MCNYFGLCGSDGHSWPFDKEEYYNNLEKQRELMMNMPFSQSPLAGLAAQHETPKQKLDRQRADWLFQSDIDRIEEKPARLPWYCRALNWLDSCPGGLSTLILLALFAAGCWAAVMLSNIYRNTSH